MRVGKTDEGARRLSFAQLCKALGKPSGYVRILQTRLGLHVSRDGEGYAQAYFAFLETVVALRTFCVPLDDICELFEAEKKLLKLLKVDSLTPSRTWYLDACGSASSVGTRLLLTQYDLEHSITPHAIQLNLDFNARAAELFAGHEMGEDVRRMLTRCLDLRDRIAVRVQSEEPVLEMALTWSARNL